MAYFPEKSPPEAFMASIKPVDQLLVYAGCDLIIDMSTSSTEYRGFQYSVGVNWQILSDVRVGASLSQYIDKDNDETGADKVQISLNAAISF